MAEIVAAFGIPHTPSFVATVAKEGPEAPVAKLFQSINNFHDYNTYLSLHLLFGFLHNFILIEFRNKFYTKIIHFKSKIMLINNL